MLKKRIKNGVKTKNAFLKKCKSKPNNGSIKNSADKELKDLDTRILLECSASQGRLNNGQNVENNSGPILTAQLFSDLPISSRTLRGLNAASYTKLTPIQSLAIPHVLASRDVIGEAETGSGKTLAFIVPLLENLFRARWDLHSGLGALVLTPTRELASQIFDVLNNVGMNHDFSAACLIGGRYIDREVKHVNGMNIIIATPGRLLQHLDESPGFDSSNLQMLVVDEADKLVDYGFSDSMKNILSYLPDSSSRQTVLFSATISYAVNQLALISLKDSYERISIRGNSNQQSLVPDRLDQSYVVVELPDQINFLFSFLRTHCREKTIVFVNSCKQARFLFEAFHRLKTGSPLYELHGRQNQQKRLQIFQEFASREKTAVLICTDIAARGIDFPAVDWVVQLNCPQDVETYIHRVGRTARYQSTGKSVLFLLPSETKFLSRLEEKGIRPRLLRVNMKKTVSICSRLSSLLAGEPEIRHLAQRAFISFLRSVSLSSDRDVFDVWKMLQIATKEKSSEMADSFARSFGLAVTPSLESVIEHTSPVDKQQKMSKLAKLKQKILEKRMARKTETAPDSATVEDWKLSDSEIEKRKLSKREKRVERLKQLREAEGKSKAVERTDDDDDVDVLEPVSRHEEDAAVPVDVVLLVDLNSAAARRKIRKQKIQIRADGTAKIKGLAALNRDDKAHLLFDSDDDVAAANSVKAIALQLKTLDAGNAEVPETEHGKSGQSNHLQEIRQRLDATYDIDKATEKDRVHQRHVKKRMRDKTAQQQNSCGTEVLLASIDDECVEIENPKKHRVIEYSDEEQNNYSKDSIADLEKAALELVSI